MVRAQGPQVPTPPGRYARRTRSGTVTTSVDRAKRPVSGRWPPTGCDDAQVGAEPSECVPEQPVRARVRRWWAWAPLFGLGLGVLAGVALRIADRPNAANLIWAAVTVAALLPAAWSMLRSLWRRHFGVDVIAVLALAGALGVGEYLAGAVIAVMLATGRSLESYAQRRATRDLRALLARAPRTARRRGPGGAIEVVPLDRVAVADRLLVGPGDVVPVDGTVEEAATLDESVVTGESRLVQRAAGEAVASGVVNAGAGFGMRATKNAAQSTYAGIVRLAQEATARKAPMVRLADRYAAAFVPFTLVLAGLGWLLSGDVVRAVAVLVVATPCPLLLATPIAIVSGLSRVARRGVLVRDGGALELLGRARTLLVDKTGTLTAGRPRAAETVVAPGGDRDEVLRLAASVEQLSPHVLAAALVRQARDRGLTLTEPTGVTEEPGRGSAAGSTAEWSGSVRSPGSCPSGQIGRGPAPSWPVGPRCGSATRVDRSARSCWRIRCAPTLAGLYAGCVRRGCGGSCWSRATNRPPPRRSRRWSGWTTCLPAARRRRRWPGSGRRPTRRSR